MEREKQIRICRDEQMKENGTASSLMEVINQKKLRAIKDGIIRAEKPLEPISENEVPYELPMGWLWIRLGEYALKVTDYVASGSFAALKENVLITNEPNYAIMVKTADFSNGFTKNLTYTDRQGYDFLSNSNLFGGELILSNIGSIGKVFIVPYLKQPMTLASNTVMVKVTDDELIKYLYFYFLSPLGQRTLKGISSGTSMMKFNKTQLKNTLVPVAPLDKQKHIVGLLEKVQAIIEARQQELQKLDELIKARFVEMFGNPITNPKGWDIVELGELTDIGSSKRIFEKEYVSEGIPFYRTKEIVELSKGNSVSTELFITEERFAEIKEKYGAPKNGDLLISAVGTIGVIWIVDGKNDFYFKDGNLIRVDGSEKFNSVYMKNLLEYLIDGYKKQMSTGTAYAALTISGLTKMKVYDIPMELQNQFADFVNQVDKSKVAVQKALDETQLLFDSLMQQYFE